MKPAEGFKVGDRVKLTIKLNARSTDPRTGEQFLADSFRLIKRGTLGTVEETNGDFLLVRFDRITTRQELRADIFKPVTP